MRSTRRHRITIALVCALTSAQAILAADPGVDRVIGVDTVPPSRADLDLLGRTEFEVRDRVHAIGAKAVQAALAGRKKGGTTAPPAPAPAAAGPPSSSAGSPGGS